MRKAILALGALLCGVGITRAASAPNSPFVNENSFFFGRVQTDRIDMARIEQFILDAMGGTASSKPADFPQLQAAVDEQLGDMIRWLGEFKEAGGHEIDMISQSGTASPDDGPAFIVPLVSGTNATQIAALLKTGYKDKTVPPPPNNNWESWPKIIPGKAVLYGSRPVRNEYKTLKPAPAPTVATAMSFTGDAPALLVLAPDAAFRTYLLQNLPPMIVTQPTRPLVEGVDWIAEYATMPPNPSLHLIAQCKDGATAMQLAGLTNLGLAFLLTDSDLGEMQNRASLVKLLTPRVKADRMEINLDTPQVAELARAMTPLVLEANQEQLRVKSMSNMRQILQGCIMYADDHKGQWPDKLDQTAKYFGGKDQMAAVMTNPQNPKRHPAFIYMKPQEPIAMPGQQMVLYESHDKFAPGVNVGFADGHIEFVSNPRRFKDLLLQAYQEASPDQ